MVNQSNELHFFLQDQKNFTFFAFHVYQQGQRIADGDRSGGSTASYTETSSHLHLTLRRVDGEHHWRTGVNSVKEGEIEKGVRNWLKQYFLDISIAL